MSGIQLNDYQEIQAWVLDVTQYAGETTIEVQASAIVEVCQILKEKFGFTYLADITGIDYYTDDLRFGVAYNMANLEAKKRLRIVVRVGEHEPQVATTIGVWPSANWFEREIWDMLGIRFQHHPDMRRIYMPEDFEYFPLRKEFPLIGIPGSIQVPTVDPPKEYK